MDSSNFAAEMWLKELDRNHSEGHMCDIIISYFESLHTLIAKKTPTLQSMLNDNITKYFINPLYYFIANGQIKELQENLKRRNKSAVCGKVFNPGEPIYTCRYSSTPLEFNQLY